MNISFIIILQQIDVSVDITTSESAPVNMSLLVAVVDAVGDTVTPQNPAFNAASESTEHQSISTDEIWITSNPVSIESGYDLATELDATVRALPFS